MAIAALILSVLALLASMGCLTIMIAKHYFSKHTVQLVPLEQEVKSSGQGGPSINPFKRIDEPLTPEEARYFQEQEKIS